jgi:glycosyltransferase involved in cell wall biosynthesis
VPALNVPATRRSTDAPSARARSPRRLRVALIAHDVEDNRGGTERVCVELVRRLADQIDFTVVSRTLAEDLREKVVWIRVPTPERPFLLKYAAFFVLAGLRLRSGDADLRHSVGAIVPNRVDVVTVHFCHAGYRVATNRFAPPGSTLLRRLNTGVVRVASIAAERWSYRRARLRAFAAVSSGIAEELDTHFPGIPVVVTPNGVDQNRFRPCVGDRAPLRAEGRPPVALFVAGDWAGKGLALAIEGLAEAVRRGAESLELWIVGRGDERRFARLALRCGVADRLRFLGFREDVERFYQAADIFVLPSNYEAHSLVAHEAAAAGLPLVVTRVNGFERLVGDNRAGALVERDPRSIGAALARLALDPELRRRQSIEARTRARAFTWERSTDGVLSLYRDLAPAGEPC